MSRRFFLLIVLWVVVWPQIGRASERNKECRFQPSLLSVQPAADAWLGEDKFRHLMASALIAGLSYNIARYDFYNPKPNAILIGCGISLSIGIMKEVWDIRRPGGTSSYRDLVADLVGVGLGALLLTETIRW